MTPKQYDRQHLRHLSAMDRRIDQLFDKALKRLASYGIFLNKPLGDQPFSFSDYPEVQRIIDGIFEEFRQSVEVTITKGLEWEDNLSASKATDLASRYGVAVAEQRSQAVAGFAQRKVGGLNLSQRVWNITDSFHKEVETAMDIALRDGTPANRLATDLKQYLKYPDKLFRRVRDEHGQLQLSKRAKEFHPGQGVYRSSYKNARRLAVTETNMAYHKADNERWRQLDFVLGYEVQVSGTNPNVCPLCEELAGKYPKEFEFVGWHPHCRCHAVPIMEDIDSFQARQDALLRGERIPATGQVTAPPKSFTDHLANNSDRLQRASKAGTLPYFVRDNYKVGKDGTLTPTFASKTPQAIKGKKDFVIEYPLGKLRSDPTGIGTLVDCASYLIENRNLKKREQAFHSMLRSEIHKTDKGGAIIMQGAKPTKTEIQTANKLVQAKNGYNTIFLSPHQISKLKEMLGIKNNTNADVLLVDRKSYVARLADLKTIGSASRETIKAHLMKGSEQAHVVVLDIQGQVKRFDLIKGIRDGWCKDTKFVLLNYKGQWYEINKGNAFKKKWLENNIG